MVNYHYIRGHKVCFSEENPEKQYVRWATALKDPVLDVVKNQTQKATMHALGSYQGLNMPVAAMVWKKAI
jgi:hypothetical protein